MIARVEGTVVSVRLDSVVVSVGGVGLLVHATPDTLSGLRPGMAATLSTSLVVREDALTLFGFADDDARDTFELVQTVSGVGPRLALAMLAVHTPDRLRAAVAGQDVAALVKVPGIGRKGAQRILLELADRMPAPVPGAAVPADGVPVPVVDPVGVQVVAALAGLGWSQAQAEAAVAAVTAEGADGAVDGATPEASVVLRAALRRLGRR